MIFSRIYHHCGGGGRCNDLIGVVIIIYFSLEYKMLDAVETMFVIQNFIEFSS